ncbi:MAG: 16S rRNA (uracil(1498)-N(3))-methyltransferase [Prevotella sp.]|nr:16S rRNA (uracil(1498)-N(3))-methyltransferase [Prevotella sp.]
MKEVRYFYVPNAGEVSELPQEEATHALRVLRLKDGDEMFLMDGVGAFFRATVTMANNKHCFYQIEETIHPEKTWRNRIHLAVAPTKMIERMEWLAEKATEVGFDELSFLDCRFSERRVVREDRIEKIVVSAMKQSRKPFKPMVNGMCPMADFVAAQSKNTHRFIAHCYDEIEKKDFFDELRQIDDNEEVIIMIGPEGDFSVEEVQQAMEAGYVSVSLGASRLRTETAALSAVMMANLVFRKV